MQNYSCRKQNTVEESANGDEDTVGRRPTPNKKPTSIYYGSPKASTKTKKIDPNVLRHEVLSFLTIREVSRAMQTCKSWFKCLVYGDEKAKHLLGRFCTTVRSVAIHVPLIPSLNFLSEITLLLGHFSSNLHSIHLYSDEFYEAQLNYIRDFSFLKQCVNLQRLVLQCPVSIRYATVFEKCTSLVHLDLRYNIHAENMDALSSCTRLQYLNLSCCNRLTRIDKLSNCTQLRYLNLFWNELIVDYRALLFIEDLDLSHSGYKQTLGNKESVLPHTYNYVVQVIPHKDFVICRSKTRQFIQVNTRNVRERSQLAHNQIVLDETRRIRVIGYSRISNSVASPLQGEKLMFWIETENVVSFWGTMLCAEHVANRGFRIIPLVSARGEQ